MEEEPESGQPPGEIMRLFQGFAKIISGYSLQGVVREQVETVLGSISRLIVSNSVIAVFTLMVFRGTPAMSFGKVWFLGTLFSLIVTMFGTKRISADAWEDSEAPAIARKLVLMAATRGLFWFAGLATLMALAEHEQADLMGFVAFGMLVGGVFSYWTLPMAALVFSGLIFTGASIGLALNNFEARFALFVILAVSFVFFNRVALSHAASLRRHVETAGHLRAEQEVVSLLLRDFEDSSRDWLWMTDATGSLTRGKKDFVNVLPRLDKNLSEMELVAALESYAADQRQRDGVVALRKALQRGVPFAEIEIIGGDPQDPVHIALSAKPRLSPSGETLGWHGVASNISAARKAEACVQHMAHFDSLTGLPNRVHLRDRLNETLAHGAPVNGWLFYGDLDGFKHVNDTLGHGAGDAVLVELAKRFTSLMLPGEIAARLGGDEFIFVLSRETAALEKTWQALVSAAGEPVSVQGQALVVGMSLGIVALEGDTANVDELLRRADLALYNAKQQGKGTARHYQRSMDETVTQRRAMERELRQAIAEKAFEIHYQPIYACGSGKLQSYEALMRWNHSVLGPISPATFIPIAEDCGLIGELGAWALRRACSDAASFPPGVGVSVNISAIQLRSRRLLADVTKALDESHLPPARLELEMTESALMENVDLTKSIIEDLKALGVGVALDDFGTGYSSLAYLHRFRFDRIKIDRSFVQAYGQRTESKAVVDAVVMIARQLGIGITAEGIETVEQYQAMVERGCDMAQGYLLGRPAPLGNLAVDESHSAAISA